MPAPLGALSTVGPLETASGQRYPLLNVSTDSQLIHDATVAGTFWGHQVSTEAHGFAYGLICVPLRAS